MLSSIYYSEHSSSVLYVHININIGSATHQMLVLLTEWSDGGS